MTMEENKKVLFFLLICNLGTLLIKPDKEEIMQKLLEILVCSKNPPKTVDSKRNLFMP